MPADFKPLNMSKNVKIFAGRATHYLAEKIAMRYGTDLGTVVTVDFCDGEFQPSFEENIRGNDIFIVQSTFSPANNLLELLMLIDAARRASARNIIAVIPYFGYARQDRKDKPRVSIASKLMATCCPLPVFSVLSPSIFMLTRSRAFSMFRWIIFMLPPFSFPT